MKMKMDCFDSALLVRVFHIAVMGVITGQAYAGGFMLRDQSIAAMGNAFSSQASAITDASAVYANPAAIATFDKAIAGIALSSVSADIEIDDVQGSATGTAEGDMLKDAVIPSLYAAIPVATDLVFGIGLYAPFGLSTNYERSFRGRYFGDESSLEHIALQPTLAWHADQYWSVAVDFTFNRAEGVLSQAVPPFFSPGDILAKAEGEDDSAYGYGFGVLYSADNWSAGLVYRSAVDFTLQGETTLDAGTFHSERDAKIDFTTPSVLDLSVTWTVQPGTDLHASISRVGWHVFDELRVETEGLPDTVEQQEWHDANYYALGLTQAFNSAWFLRAGMGYDETPQPGRTRSVRLADNDRIFLAAGAGYRQGHWLVDMSALYIRQRDAAVEQASSVGSFSAEYRTRIYTLATQASYRF